MTAQDYAMCTFCPRLCRHVCPTAVATSMESATATSMMAAAWLALETGVAVDSQALSLCLGCGACTRHCKHHVPVADLVDAAAGRSVPVRPDAALPPLGGPGADPGRFTTCFEGGIGAPHQLACCGRRDGFALREPAAAAAVAHENVRLLAGRGVRCGDKECAAWLIEHGANVEFDEAARIAAKGLA
ncbi:MAG: hypothetical protein EXR69_04475 [Myxococcales bacterium]|nr:hypothetical protein [Myxococcales bacterium]